MHIAKQEAFTHRLLRIHHVVRIAGERIQRHHGDHAANLQGRVDGMPQFDHLRAGDKLMVQHLVHALFRIRFLGENHP
ncbi:hypothetical protein D3C80_1867180 [compost metagenome]